MKRKLKSIFTAAATAATLATPALSTESNLSVHQDKLNLLSGAGTVARNIMADNRGVNKAIMHVAQCEQDVDLKKMAVGVAASAAVKKGVSAAFNVNMGAGALVNFISSQRGLRRDLIDTTMKLNAEGSPYAKVFMTSKTQDDPNPKMYFALYSPTEDDPNNVIVLSNGMMNKETKKAVIEHLLSGIRGKPERAMEKIVENHGCGL